MPGTPKSAEPRCFMPGCRAPVAADLDLVNAHACARHGARWATSIARHRIASIFAEWVRIESAVDKGEHK